MFQPPLLIVLGLFAPFQGSTAPNPFAIEAEAPPPAEPLESHPNAKFRCVFVFKNASSQKQLYYASIDDFHLHATLLNERNEEVPLEDRRAVMSIAFPPEAESQYKVMAPSETIPLARAYVIPTGDPRSFAFELGFQKTQHLPRGKYKLTVQLQRQFGPIGEALAKKQGLENHSHGFIKSAPVEFEIK